MNVNILYGGGDFNLVQEKCVDSYNRSTNNDKSKRVINMYMEQIGLRDVWRIYHENEQRYTCFQRKPSRAARLDYFLVTDSLLSAVNGCDIHSTSTFSDHNAVTVSLQLDDFLRGKGLWRMNNRLLSNTVFIKSLKSEICKVSRESAHLLPDKKWEWIKHNIRKSCQLEGMRCADTRAETLKALYDACNVLELERCQEKHADLAAESLSEINDKILELEQYEIEGSMFRSRAHWIAEGEKNSKYFFALEKRNYARKLMTKLRGPQGEITDQHAILREQQSFYEALYTSNQDIRFNLTNTKNVVITENMKNDLEREVQLQECKMALESMKQDKAPGCDGLTVELYKCVFEEIQGDLYRMYMYCHEVGMLNSTARKGVISLLPKGDKDPTMLKNWRPLTLLNIDYKILAKCLADRLKKCLDKIISPQQTGFMAGRQITDNIRKTMDVIAYKQSDRCLIMTIDFEKCFDRIEYEAVFGSMRYFGIGENYISWVKLFFTEFHVCTQNAGYLSNFFKKTRGVNQGCPISPYLYLLCGEVMAHRLQMNNEIRGVWIYDVYFLLSQFADDTALFLEYDEVVLNAVLDELSIVEQHTGLKISYEKTTVYRVGSIQNTCAKLYTRKQIMWSDGDISLLGVTITNGPKQAVHSYDSSIDKMSKIMMSWSKRKLTLMGKVLVVNTLMASLFVYKFQVLPAMTGPQINKINKCIQEYLWGVGKKPKIPLKVLQSNKK